MIETHQAGCPLADPTEQETYDRHLAQFEADVAAYRAAWPKHCGDCGGWGGNYSTYDPSPAGVSLSPGYMIDFDPCETCVEHSLCPRCGEKTCDLVERPEGDHFLCSKCGWTDHADNQTEGLPLDPPDPPHCECDHEA